MNHHTSINLKHRKRMLTTDNATIHRIFNAQKYFFKTGATKSISFRKESLQRLRQSILNHAEDLYLALDKDLGKSKDLVDRTEIGRVISELDFMLAHLDEWARPEAVPEYPGTTFSEAFIEHEAFGVSYIIGPFNYPINLVFCPLLGAIVGGNTAIIKPSNLTPESAKVIEKIIASTFHEEYIAVIQGGKDENTYLLSLPFDFIFFTGSPATGKIVMAAAAKNLTPVILELGGKSPFIVLSDADIDRTVNMLAFGRFSNSGQTCVAPDYVLADESIKDMLLSKLLEKIKTTIPGIDAIGKLVSEKQVEYLTGMLTHTQGKIIFGGQANVATRHMQATVVTEVNWHDELMRSELFGPILPVLTFTDINDAVESINQYHPKPLAAYVFTNNIEQGKEIISRIPSGDAIINGVMQQATSPYLPFGGTGMSGMGEYRGYYSYLAFTHRKSIVINK